MGNIKNIDRRDKKLTNKRRFKADNRKSIRNMDMKWFTVKPK